MLYKSIYRSKVYANAFLNELKLCENKGEENQMIGFITFSLSTVLQLIFGAKFGIMGKGATVLIRPTQKHLFLNARALQ